MITRRRLLGLFPAIAVWCQSELHAQTRLSFHKAKPVVAASLPIVYFGTDTARPGAKGIYVSRFDTAKGRFSAPMLAAAALHPSFFAMSQLRDRRALHVCNEGDERTSKISSYAVDGNGGLKLLGEVPSGGGAPCYISVDASGRSAFVANYTGGTVASFRVLADGSLSPVTDRIDFHDAKVFGHDGPVTARQEGPHPHSAILSPDNRFLLVNDLGHDAISVFPIDADTAHLGAPHVTENRFPGSGPRHLAFHPNGRWIYGVDEISSKIDQYLWNTTHAAKDVAAEGLLTDVGHTVSTLDPGFKGTNTAAEIAVSPNGFFVYASNRGEDSLVMFMVDQTTGNLTAAQRIACGGKAPRHFTMDPTGAWLVCGNQDSDTVTVFARDSGTGMLKGPVQTMPLAAPQFTLFT